MSGPFQKAIDEIAIRSGTNGGPTMQDLLTAMIAGHDEAEATAELLRLETKDKADKLAEELRIQHQQSLDAIEANRRVLEAHLLEAQLRDCRIELVESHIEESKRTCKERIEALIKEEHQLFHQAHLDRDHATPPPLPALQATDDADFRERLMWFFATATGKVFLVILGVVLAIILNVLIYGRP